MQRVLRTRGHRPQTPRKYNQKWICSRGTYFSRCNKHIRSLATFNFFETILFKFSTDIWLSTLTEKQPPVVVFTFSVICDRFSSVPHPMCCWISCESLPILSNQIKSNPMAMVFFPRGLASVRAIRINSEWWRWSSRFLELLYSSSMVSLLFHYAHSRKLAPMPSCLCSCESPPFIVHFVCIEMKRKKKTNHTIQCVAIVFRSSRGCVTVLAERLLLLLRMHWTPCVRSGMCA